MNKENNEKEKYKGILGFKNGAPAYAHNPGEGVQLFLDTWGFLPNDDSVLEQLNKEQLVELCQSALSVSCEIDINGNGIKNIQRLMNKFGISPSQLKN